MGQKIGIYSAQHGWLRYTQTDEAGRVSLHWTNDVAHARYFSSRDSARAWCEGEWNGATGEWAGKPRRATFPDGCELRPIEEAPGRLPPKDDRSIQARTDLRVRHLLDAILAGDPAAFVNHLTEHEREHRAGRERADRTIAALSALVLGVAVSGGDPVTAITMAGATIGTIYANLGRIAGGDLS